MATWNNNGKHWACECGSSKWVAQVWGQVAVVPSPSGAVDLPELCQDAELSIDDEDGEAVTCAACGEPFTEDDYLKRRERRLGLQRWGA